MSKCEVTYLANIYASKAKTLKLNDWSGYDVKKILFIEVFISELSPSGLNSSSAFNLCIWGKKAKGTNFRNDRKNFDML